MDCISNSHREHATSVVVLDVYAQLPDGNDPRTPWPLPPKRTASTYALEEGGKRRWGTEVTGFGGRGGHRQPRLRPPGDRDLVARSHPGAGVGVRARGRSRADRDRLPASRARGPRLRARPRDSTAAATSARAQTYRTSVGRVYACGDARIGQSLVVTAIAEGRKCARIVNADLGGSPDGCRPGAPGRRCVERRVRPDAAPRGRGGRIGPSRRPVLHRPGHASALAGQQIRIPRRDCPSCYGLSPGGARISARTIKILGLKV